MAPRFGLSDRGSGCYPFEPSFPLTFGPFVTLVAVAPVELVPVLEVPVLDVPDVFPLAFEPLLLDPVELDPLPLFEPLDFELLFFEPVLLLLEELEPLVFPLAPEPFDPVFELPLPLFPLELPPEEESSSPASA